MMTEINAIFYLFGDVLFSKPIEVSNIDDHRDVYAVCKNQVFLWTQWYWGTNLHIENMIVGSWHEGSYTVEEKTIYDNTYLVSHRFVSVSYVPSKTREVKVILVTPTAFKDYVKQPPHFHAFLEVLCIYSRFRFYKCHCGEKLRLIDTNGTIDYCIYSPIIFHDKQQICAKCDRRFKRREKLRKK